MGLRTKVYAIGLGAGLMYFYDPEHGESRRSEFSAQWAKFQRDAQEYWNTTSRDLTARFESAKSSAEKLKQDPQSVVESVKNRAQAGFSAMSDGNMQGEQMRMAQGPAGQPSPSTNLLLALAGGGLTFYGLMRGGIKGTAATFMGLRVLARGMTETPVGKMFSGSPPQNPMQEDPAQRPSMPGQEQMGGRMASDPGHSPQGRAGSGSFAYGMTSTANPAAGSSTRGEPGSANDETAKRRQPNRGNRSDETAANTSAAQLPANNKPQTGASAAGGQARADLPSWGESRTGGRGGNDQPGEEIEGFDSIVPGLGDKPSEG